MFFPFWLAPKHSRVLPTEHTAGHRKGQSSSPLLAPWKKGGARPKTGVPVRNPPSLLLPLLSSFPLPSFLCWLSPAPPLFLSCSPSLFLLSYLPLLAASLFSRPLLYSVTALGELNLKKKRHCDTVMQDLHFAMCCVMSLEENGSSRNYHYFYKAKEHQMLLNSVYIWMLKVWH